MKKILLMAFLGSFFCQVGYAQTTPVKTDNQDLALYRRALKYSDLSSAAFALTQYLHKGGDSTFQDTLALIYYNMNNLQGAYKMSGEINQQNPKNVTALSLLADISGRAGEVKTSLEWYEKLVVLSPEAYNHYQLATKQFVLERNLECRQSLQKVIADSAAAKQQKVRLDVGEGYGEDVPVLAAAMNMLGALAYKEKNTALAEDWYAKAVAVFPEFVIAKQNLDSLKKEAAGGKSQPAGKPAPKPAVKKG